MLFYKCLKDKAMNIEINQYSYLSPKNNNKQKGTILDTNTRMVPLLFEYIKLDRDKSTFKSHRDFSSEIEITFKHF